jgi:hypothetical protein
MEGPCAVARGKDTSTYAGVVRKLRILLLKGAAGLPAARNPLPETKLESRQGVPSSG